MKIHTVHTDKLCSALSAWVHFTGNQSFLNKNHKNKKNTDNVCQKSSEDYSRISHMSHNMLVIVQIQIVKAQFIFSKHFVPEEKTIREELSTMLNLFLLDK